MRAGLALAWRDGDFGRPVSSACDTKKGAIARAFRHSNRLWFIQAVARGRRLPGGLRWAGFCCLASCGAASCWIVCSCMPRTLPVGTGYAVWTGIGAAGTAILGMAVLGDSAAPMRVMCTFLFW
jgi:multidrug transporter EmrE-like cation transporter